MGRLGGLRCVWQDRLRIHLTLSHLLSETVLAHPQILDVPLLLLANKQDAPNSLSVNDVRASYEAWWQTRRADGEDTAEPGQIGAGMIMGDDQRAASLDVMGVSALEGYVLHKLKGFHH